MRLLIPTSVKNQPLTPAQKLWLERKRSEESKFKFQQYCFDKQIAFINDPHPFATAVCSVRAGKTVACAADLIRTSLSRAGIVCLYITLSRANAKKIIWPELCSINTNFKLGGKVNESELSISFPNRSVIYASGAKDKREIEKFRGLALALCYIDECQAFRDYIRELVDEVIAKRLFDYAGKLRLIGTPGPVPIGYFYECSISDQWSHHEWTMFNNPWLPKKSGLTHEEILERELKRKGVTVDDPSIQRECFGKWAFDPNSLVFRYNKELNHYDKLPDSNEWNHIIGIDVGYDDADAIAVIAWSPDYPGAYLIHEDVAHKQGITALAAKVEVLITRYNPDRIVMDTGGLGKKIAEELQSRYGQPIVAAEKTRKFEFIEILNDAMRTGRFFASDKGRFSTDCNLVEWDRDSDRLKIKDTYHSDICFPAGTKIATEKGEKAIEEISLNDLILTRDGYKPVMAIGVTNESADIYETVISNGAILRCTKNHPIMTKNRGAVACDALTYDDELISLSECEKQSTLTARCFTDTRRQSKALINGITLVIMKEGGWPFIERYTKSFTARLNAVCISITSMAIGIITRLRTLSQSPPVGTLKIIGTQIDKIDAGNLLRILLKPGMPPLSGINPLRAESGISNNTKPLLVRPENKYLPSAQFADANTKQTASQQKEKSLNSTVRVSAAPRLIETACVYNLTVKDKHEYYANGILVSNCDAVLYAFREAFHWLYETPKKKIITGSEEWKQKQIEEMEKAAYDAAIPPEEEDIWNRRGIEDE